MPDNKSKKKIDGKLISLKERHEVSYWTQALGVNRSQLEAAVKKVGHRAVDVRRWLALPRMKADLKEIRASLRENQSHAAMQSAAAAIKFLDACGK